MVLIVTFLSWLRTSELIVFVFVEIGLLLIDKKFGVGFEEF